MYTVTRKGDVRKLCAPHKKALLDEQAVVILGGKQYMESLYDSIHYFLFAHGTTHESATVHGL